MRESRRITGDYALTISDVQQGARPSDTIALGSHGIDIHSTRQTAEHRMDYLTDAYGIPYRCLLPVSLDNVLVAGRCLSATHEAMASTRVMAQCMATGQAAGTAAALAAGASGRPRDIDPEGLCRLLRSQEAILDGGVPVEMSGPVLG